MADFQLQSLLQEQVFDKLIPVIVAGDKALEEKIAGLGTRVGSSDTYAGLPSVDQNGKAVTVGDTARLKATDGANPAGLYEWDGTKWDLTLNFDAIDIGSIIEGAKATQAEFDAKAVDKFATPAEVINHVIAEIAKLSDIYHPKGGDEALAVKGKNGQENTQEFVTANQMKATFTQAEIQAQYDAL